MGTIRKAGLDKRESDSETKRDREREDIEVEEEGREKERVIYVYNLRERKVFERIIRDLLRMRNREGYNEK